MKKFGRLLFVPLGFFCVLVVRLLDKVGIRIRFGEFFSNRLGHLAGNTECYLCEKEAGLQKGFDIWAHSGPPANPYLAKMISRRVLTDPTGFTRLISLCNSTITGWEKHYANPTQMDRDIYNLFEKQRPHITFTREEENRGHEAVKRLGIPYGRKWVYLIVRDSAKHPGLPYHSYRNADIDNYMLAAENLTKLGYYVVRMGKTIEKPLKTTNPKIIDFHKHYDDFLSIYLGAHCEFCISTSTGPDAIPYIFRRPIVYTDFVPVEYLFSFLRNSLAIWKHHEKDGKRMSFEEIIESGAGKFMRTDQFEQAGIKLIPNTQEEIWAVVKEMVRHVKSPQMPDENQTRFWKKFPNSISEYNNQPLHGKVNMRIGSEFLKGYQ